VKIEILYFDGCPNRDATLERVKEVLHQEDLSAEIVEVNVRDAARAQAHQFLGSPTVRIDGLDVEPAARKSKDFGLMCRTYPEGGGRVGVPPLALIRAALKERHPAPHPHRCRKTVVTRTLALFRRLFLPGHNLRAALGAPISPADPSTCVSSSPEAHPKTAFRRSMNRALRRSGRRVPGCRRENR